MAWPLWEAAAEPLVAGCAAPMLRRSKLTPDQPVLGEAGGKKAGKLSSLSLFSLHCSTAWRLEAAAGKNQAKLVPLPAAAQATRALWPFLGNFVPKLGQALLLL